MDIFNNTDGHFSRPWNSRSLAILAAILIVPVFVCISCAVIEPVCDAEASVTPADTTGFVQFDAHLHDNAASFPLCGSDGPLFDNRFSPYKGGRLSPELVVEHYSAFNCPHCAHFAEYVDEMLATRPAIKQRVRFYFHHFPFTNYTHYHMAAFAVSQQGMDKFWAFHDILFANTSIGYDYQALRDIAVFELAVDASKYDEATTYATAAGQQALQFLDYEKKTAKANCINSTPSVYICGQPVADWRDLETLIFEYLTANK